MTKDEGGRLAGLELEVKELHKDMESVIKNHLPHLSARVDLILKVIGWGLALIGLFLTLYSILIMAIIW